MAGLVDIKTGKIIGVEKGTRAYWHEVGHIEFSKTSEGMRLQYVRQSMVEVVLVLLFSAIVLHKMIAFAAGIVLIGYFGIGLYEEKWCWRFADAKLSKK